MKSLTLKTLMAIPFLFMFSVLSVTESQENIEPVPVPKMVLSFPEFPASAKKLEPVEIGGAGYAIGDIFKEDDKLFLGKSVGFILPKENKGGVLKIGFVSLPEEPVKLSFRLFPIGGEPEILELKSGKIEVQILSRQVYIFLNVEGADRLGVDEIKFAEGITLSAKESCDCRQIKMLSENNIDVSELQKLLNK